MTNRSVFVPDLSGNLPTTDQARNRRSGALSAAMFTGEVWPFAKSTGASAEPLSEYFMEACVGLARSQSVYVPADGMVNVYSASPFFVSSKCARKSPPESSAFFTWP